MITLPNSFEPAYVIDTNALYWYLAGDNRLSRPAKAVFQAAEQGQTHLFVFVISLAELFWILEKRPLAQSYSIIYLALQTRSFIEFVPLEAAHIVDFVRDDVIPEMHDHIIVGVALRLRAPLITSDSIIATSGIVRVVW